MADEIDGYDWTSIFDDMIYGGDNGVTVDTSGIDNSGSDNDSRTTSDTSGFSNEIAKSLQDICIEPIIQIKDKAIEAVQNVASELKIPIALAGLTAAFAGTYFLLAIAGGIKNNLKTIKGKA